jgi:hypothetical protein
MGRKAARLAKPHGRTLRLENRCAETRRRLRHHRDFPRACQTADRLVAGFNDSHLDFRVVVDVATSGGGQQVTATTLVLTHNLLGRVYLASILPFHRLVVRALLRQVAA